MRRTITVTSDPPGALLWLNGREIGRTPVDVDFLYYGIYDVELIAEGHEPLITTGEASPPWWDRIPMDLVSELSPEQQHARIVWHYTLAPSNNDPNALLERARETRAMIPPPPTPPTPPASPAPPPQAEPESAAPQAAPVDAAGEHTNEP